MAKYNTAHVREQRRATCESRTAPIACNIVNRGTIRDSSITILISHYNVVFYLCSKILTDENSREAHKKALVTQAPAYEACG